MPHRKINFPLPRWVEAIDDRCLYTTVLEALVARQHAIRWGALRHPAYRKTFAAAETTLRMIADGRVHGELACRKAADAIRKYNAAGEGAYYAQTRTRSTRSTRSASRRSTRR